MDRSRRASGFKYLREEAEPETQVGVMRVIRQRGAQRETQGEGERDIGKGIERERETQSGSNSSI